MGGRQLAALFVAMLGASTAVLVTMVALLLQFRANAGQAALWGSVLIALAGVGVALCLVATIHLTLIAARNNLPARRDRSVTTWARTWSDVASGAPMPELPAGEGAAMLQAAALVMQDVSGEGASRIRGALLATGLVRRDIALAQGAVRSRPGEAIAALERLAWIAAADALPLFLSVAASGEQRAARAALLGATRVLAAQDHPEEHGPDVVLTIEAYVASAPDPANVRSYVTSVLVAAAPHLVWLCSALLTRPLPDAVHAAALDALVSAHSPEAKQIAGEVLPAAARGESRAAALRTLTRIGQVPAAAVPTVVAATLDPEVGVRVQAVHALVGTEPSVALSALWGPLGDDAFEVRLAAAESLRRLGANGEQELLRAAVEHPDAFARDIAAAVAANPTPACAPRGPAPPLDDDLLQAVGV